MKKLLAMVLAMAMLLTMMAVMPVSADDAIYLDIENHDFEADEHGTTAGSITGWSTTGTAALVKATSEFGGTNGIHEAKGVENALTQTVEIPDNLSATAKKYNWSLSIKTVYVIYADVVVMDAESNILASKTYDSFDKRGWSPYDAEFDITATVTGATNPKYIKISLYLHNNGGAFDDVRLSAAPIPAVEGLAPNGSFENVTEGALDGWTFSGAEQAAVLTKNEAEAYDGEAYLKFEDKATASATFDVTAGKTYSVAVYHKSTANNAAIFQVYDAIGRAYAYQNTIAAAKAGWTQVNILITANKVLDGKITVRLGSNDADATVCFDAVTLIETEHDYANMILNGGFEANTAQNAEWEYIANWYNGNGTKLATDFKYEGNNSMAARQRNETSGVIVINKDDSTVTAENEKYKFSFYVNDNSLNASLMPWLRLWPLKMHGDASTSGRGDIIAYNPVITEKDTWTKCEYEVTLPADVNYVRIQLFSGAGWTRFDNFEFSQIKDIVTPGPGTPDDGDDEEEDEEDYELIPEEGNLLLNGSFEVGTVDSKKIPGWKQTGAENKYTINAHPSYIDNTDGGKQSIYADLASGLGDAGLKQTATIDTEADWYVNYEDYSYNLSYSAYAAGSIYRGYVNVIMTDANGKSYTRTYNPAPATVWAVNKVSIDLTAQTLDVEGPVASIEVQLIASSNSFEMRWDGVKLAPVPMPKVTNLIKNGSFEKDDANDTEITYWTQTREAHKFAVEEHAVYSAKAGDGGKKTAAITYPDTAVNGDEAAIKQRVTIDKNAPWYTNYEDYTYELSYTGYAAGSVMRGYINVTVTDERGKTATIKYAPGAKDVWAMNDIKVDLTSQIKGLGSAVAYFDIELVATYSPYGNGMRYDAVTLMPVYSEAMESIDINGSFETLTEEENLEGWRVVNTSLDESLIDNAMEAHTGDRYLKFEGIENTIATATVEVEYGKTYMVEVFYKATEANAASIQLRDSAGRTHVIQDTRPEKPSEWTPVRAMITIGERVPTPTIILYLASKNEEAVVCFDSVKLYCMGDFDGNMILNGDFEADNARNSEGENITNWFGGNAIKLETGTAHSGKNSYAIRQQNNAYAGQIMLNLDDSAATEEGDKFKFTFWINDSSVNPEKMPWLRLFPYKMNSDATTSARGDAIVIHPVIEAADTWTKCEVVVELPADVNYLKIQLFAGEGWTRFDDLSFVKYESAIKLSNEDGTYTAKFTNADDYEGAKLFIAHYEIADGEERLVSVNCATVGAQGSETPCSVEVAQEDIETAIIKAYVWSAGLKPIKVANNV